MKDTVKFGSEPFKKVVAQQVEKVYPTAVKTVGFKGLTYTPDIFVLSSKVETGKEGTAITINKAHGLRVWESVRLVNNKNTEMEFDVTKIVDANTFVIKTNAATKLGDKVFVYGKYCPDMKSVDYDAIAMLNVSATQELAKKLETLEEQNSNLQDQAMRLSAIEGQQRAMIAEQDKKIDALEAANERLAAVATEMEALKKLVVTMQEKDKAGVRTAMLEQ